MARPTLKSELIKFEKSELIEILVSLTKKNKEVKEYFDFFMNPDVEKLTDKYQNLISREFQRTYRGYRSKARISVIKGLIKKYINFDIELQNAIEIYCFTIGEALSAEKRFHFPDTLLRGICRLTEDGLKYSLDNFVLDQFLISIDNLLKTGTGFPRFVREIERTIQTFLADRTTKINRKF